MKAAACRRLLTLPGRTAMAHLRRCLVALLFALTIGLAGPAAHGADLKEALTRFTADDFSETSTGISEVAESGDPRAATIIEALQAGRLEFSAERKAVYYKDASDRLIDAATGQPAAGDPPADLAPVRLNNRLRRGIDAAIGGLTLMSADPEKRYAAAQAVFKSRDEGALPALNAALTKETDASIKRALAEARARRQSRRCPHCRPRCRRR
jgi:urea transport system permease protein